MSKKRQANVALRFLIPGTDMPDIMEIEESSFTYPWSKKDFFAHLRQPNCGGSVAVFEERVIGYAVYYLEREIADLFLVNLAVAPDCRRLGVGTRIMAGLLKRAVTTNLTSISLALVRPNVGAMLFYRYHGFKVTKLLPRFYAPTGDDAWQMRYSFNNPGEAK